MKSLTKKSNSESLDSQDEEDKEHKKKDSTNNTKESIKEKEISSIKGKPIENTIKTQEDKQANQDRSNNEYSEEKPSNFI